MNRLTEQHTTDLQPSTSGPGFDGHSWSVTIIGARSPEEVVHVGTKAYVSSLNGRLYNCEGLASSVPMWEGIKVYDNHLTDREFDDKQGMRSVAKEWIGTIVKPFWNDKLARLQGTLKIVDESLAKKLKAAYDQGVLGTVGLSIDTEPQGREGTHEGKQMSFIEGFKKIYSVDLVAEPAAGGAIDRLIAADTRSIGSMEMSQLILRSIRKSSGIATLQLVDQDGAVIFEEDVNTPGSVGSRLTSKDAENYRPAIRHARTKANELGATIKDEVGLMKGLRLVGQFESSMPRISSVRGSSSRSTEMEDNAIRDAFAEEYKAALSADPSRDKASATNIAASRVAKQNGIPKSYVIRIAQRGGLLENRMSRSTEMPKDKEPTTAAAPAEPGLEITPEFEEYLKGLIKEELGDQSTAEEPNEEVEEEPSAEAVREIVEATLAEVESASIDSHDSGAWVAESVFNTTAARAHRAEAALSKVDELEARLQIRETLERAKLTNEGLRLVESAVSGWVAFDKKEFNTLVNTVKRSEARRDPTGHAREGSGHLRGSGISVGMNERDKAEVEFLRLVAGNMAFRELEHNDKYYVKERMPESIKAWIRSGRPNYGTHKLSEWTYAFLGGDPLTDQRAYETVTTSGMGSIVKNALNLILAADYSQKYEWWDPIVRQEEVDTIDQATLVRVYGLSNLPIVAEGEAYQELAWTDEEETASFVKNGSYVGVTMETLLRDKLNVVKSIPDRLSNSWYNTLSARVSGVFTLNGNVGPVLGDTGALFNAAAATVAGGHINLLTTALSFAAYGAARTAMRKQTDQALGVGARLLVEPKFLLCPVDLETTALQIRNSEYVPYAGGAAAAAPADVNPHYQKFDVIPVPHWTDTTDWALVADPKQFPAIWMIFLRGKRVPELFTSDSDVSGAMFTNDTLRYKVRMLAFQFSSTYDCAPVSDFRPLHKSNV